MGQGAVFLVLFGLKLLQGVSFDLLLFGIDFQFELFAVRLGLFDFGFAASSPAWAAAALAWNNCRSGSMRASCSRMRKIRRSLSCKMSSFSIICCIGPLPFGR